jgi:hypothetical protein
MGETVARVFEYLFDFLTGIFEMLVRLGKTVFSVSYMVEVGGTLVGLARLIWTALGRVPSIAFGALRGIAGEMGVEWHVLILALVGGAIVYWLNRL